MPSTKLKSCNATKYPNAGKLYGLRERIGGKPVSATQKRFMDKLKAVYRNDSKLFRSELVLYRLPRKNDAAQSLTNPEPKLTRWRAATSARRRFQIGCCTILLLIALLVQQTY